MVLSLRQTLAGGPCPLGAQARLVGSQLTDPLTGKEAGLPHLPPAPGQGALRCSGLGWSPGRCYPSPAGLGSPLPAPPASSPRAQALSLSPGSQYEAQQGPGRSLCSAHLPAPSSDRLCPLSLGPFCLARPVMVGEKKKQDEEPETCPHYDPPPPRVARTIRISWEACWLTCALSLPVTVNKVLTEPPRHHELSTHHK